ncbi:PRTRC system protein C [Pedobacter xixiisoli]|uniref:PRTRC system protein C n=1 Tax=Pedobacter xixiisoli TaxID=1476464 RepID=A0A286A770_9SPHI|nr:PRTRC system protein C [Pedobacter xixiisoli]SOD17773.1 PRTRC system protein C [Pedobacter xixiisoli]
MLLATALERVFIINDKGNEIRLTDPDPTWSEQSVINYYANEYPILATAKISAPQFNADKVEFRLESVMGTKG